MMKRVLVDGDGCPPPDGASVQTRYEIIGDGDTEVASRAPGRRGAGFAFVLGQGEAVGCVESAVRTMTRGEVACLSVEGAAAAELRELAPSLAPCSAVRIVLELEGWTPNPSADGPAAARDAAAAHKEAGNVAFKAKQFARAIREYMCAMDLVEQALPPSACASFTPSGTAAGAGGAAALAVLRLDLLNNIALCSVQTGNFAAALHHCNQVLEEDRVNTKGLNRRARACLGLHDFGSARRDCNVLLEVAAGLAGDVGRRVAKDARAVLGTVEKAEAAERKAERDAFGQAFATVGITLPRSDSRDVSL